MGFANILAIFLSITVAVAVNGNNIPTKLFNVMKYGAVADDSKTDNGPTFLKTWEDACAYPGKSGVLIPRGTYMTGLVMFSGPCKGPIVFLLQGTLQAPMEPYKFLGKTWIGFRHVDRLRLTGGGVLHGPGLSASNYNDCNNNSGCEPLPTSLGLDSVRNSRIENLRSVYSTNTHINIFACSHLNISQVMLTAPKNIRNTDGIKIGSSDNIKITDSTISTGDDCVTMLSGSQNIDISGLNCGPGHGISIGGLGKHGINIGSNVKDPEKDYVMGIRVRKCSFFGTDNGVRIKTWAPSSSSLASDLSFEDIYMRNVSNPIVIDQNYCPNCKPGSSSGVQLQNVTLKNIWGISQTEVAVNIQCSKTRPCKNVKLVNINLSYMNETGKAIASCSNVAGTVEGRQNPKGCF